ncbi:MAG TPA: UDP-4-amino-4,6-dideoxy-N-acetyl-beta-L-altrosamine N-acetyltransferase [Elusimicrobiota bacterium]|nr:UDP-4-amino-4,6-dideoxy-N-acetyl-beta-L-altrosamine N-acetyltransferase [Elusimicrobiota bacterium]
MLKVEFADIVGSNESLLEQILLWRNSPGIRRFMYQDDVISAEAHRRWYAALENNPNKKYWVMNVDEKPAGLVNLVNIDSRNKNSEWAFYIGEAWAQKLGLGRIAEFHTLDYAFLTLGLEKLNCAVLDFNKAVVNMHKGFGFREEGFLRHQIQRPEGRCGVHLLGITRQEWLENRQAVFEKKLGPLGEYSFRYADGTKIHPVGAV